MEDKLLKLQKETYKNLIKSVAKKKNKAMLAAITFDVFLDMYGHFNYEQLTQWNKFIKEKLI